MNSLRNAFYQAKHNLYETGVNLMARDKDVRDFEHTGQLTTQEFIEAGDQLLKISPVWEWQAPSNDAIPTGPLPREKSFLMYRGAPCHRFATNDSAEEQFRSIDGEDDAASTTSTDPDEAELEGMIFHTTADETHHIYDVSLTYSKPNHTPQIFFTGFTANRSRSLTAQEMSNDVAKDYFGVDKTVTIENHPFLAMPSISVHPCRHAESMRNLIARARKTHETTQQQLPEDQREPFTFDTKMSLVLFLKFISSVTPTIQYDTTPEFVF